MPDRPNRVGYGNLGPANTLSLVILYTTNETPERIARDVFGTTGPVTWEDDHPSRFHIQRMQTDFAHFWLKLDAVTQQKLVWAALNYFRGETPHIEKELS